MGATWDTEASTPKTKYDLNGKPLGYFLTSSAALHYIFNTCLRTNSQTATIFRDKYGTMCGFARWYPDKGWGLAYWIDSGIVPHAASAEDVLAFVDSLKVRHRVHDGL
jgi:hypothetical protein